MLRYIITTTFFLLLRFSFYGQELPPVLNYSPNTYQAANQNWMISQSSDKTIYVANNSGLLQFNGAQWKLYPSPNETIIRGVKAVGSKVYTGSYMDFGMWEEDSKGILTYQSIAHKMELRMIEDEHIWNIESYKQYVLFQSLDRIYIYNSENDQIQIITPTQKLIRLFLVGDELFFQVKDGALYSIENTSPQIYSRHNLLSNNHIINLFKIGGKLIGVTATKGFFEITKTNVVPWEIRDQELLKEITIYSALMRENNSIVLGTIENGIIQLSEGGAVEYKIKKGTGLNNNTALSLFEDQDKNLWVGLDAGIDCINMDSKFSQYIDLSGTLGTIYASAMSNGYTYLGTNQGLFYKRDASSSDFARMPGTEGQVWSLRIIDGTLFCGHNRGTFIIKKDQQELISKVEGTWDIKKIQGSSNLLLQGNYDGLYVLEKKENSWKIRNKIKNFINSSKHFEIQSNNSVLVNHEYKGVFEIQVDPDFYEAKDISKHANLGTGEHSGLSRLGDDIIYAKKTGIYIYNKQERTFYKDASLSAIFTNENFVTGKLIEDQDRIWTFTSNELVSISKDKLDGSFEIKKISIPSGQRKTVEGYESFSRFRESKYLLGTSYGYLLVDIANQNSNTYQVHLNEVSIRDLGETSRLVSLTENGDFLSQTNYIQFAYGVAEFNKFLTAEYATSLDGFYEEWSDWNLDSSISYENLPYGSYTFRVKARVGGVESTNQAIYSFKIARPWFLSNIAIVLYILLAIFLFTALNWFYKRYYRRQQQQILERAQQDMQLKSLENEKQIVELNNANLKQDIDARNRELAVSTMNMINKNKTLTSIKSALLKVKQMEDVESIIKIVNTTIENEEDWTFFEQAFNHADKDFFRKVKEKHPILTANDLKLCVYLRLNMSSKEIAPLLNISSRSVEIKRYRLRKKLDLSREVNLNDYFINL